MAIQKVTLYVHSLVRSWKPEPEIFVAGQNMGSIDDYTLICTRQVDIDIPEFDATGLLIEKLEAEVQKERAESQSRVNILLERISKLKAITHEVPA